MDSDGIEGCSSYTTTKTSRSSNAHERRRPKLVILMWRMVTAMKDGNCPPESSGSLISETTTVETEMHLLPHLERKPLISTMKLKRKTCGDTPNERSWTFRWLFQEALPALLGVWVV
jgi:hypothetical protein